MDIDRIIVACYLGQIISRLFWVLEIVALIAVFYDIIWVLAITEKDYVEINENRSFSKVLFNHEKISPKSFMQSN